MTEENNTQQNIENKIESDWRKGLFTVTPLSKYFAMVLFIILPFLGFWGGQLYEQALHIQSDGPCESCESRLWLCERDKKILPEKTPETVEDPLTMYSDVDTGVSFSYPTQWGKVTFEDERGECDESSKDPCNFRVYLFKDLVEAGIFLVMETRGHQENPVGRGGFWGDGIGAITSSFADDCTKDVTCELYTNSNGIVFAKRTAPVFDWNDSSPLEIVYDTYSNKGAYYGIRLSPLRIKSAGEPIEKMFEETVVSSLTLTSH